MTAPHADLFYSEASPVCDATPTRPVSTFASPQEAL